MANGGMTMRELLEWFGITSASPAAAGFSGGVVHIFWYKKTKPFDAVGAIICGFLTSIWIAEPIGAHIGVPPVVVGFFIGLGGVQGLAPVFAMLRQKVLGKAASTVEVP